MYIFFNVSDIYIFQMM